MRGVEGAVGEDHVRTGASKGEEAFEQTVFVGDPAPLGRGAQHRVFPTHVISGHGEIGLVAQEANDIGVGEAGLDHHPVGSLGLVETQLAQRLARVGRIHLVGLLVPAPRRGVEGLPEGSVEGGGVLNAIAADRGVGESGTVEGLADRAHPAVHHVRRRDDVGAGLGLGDGHRRQDGEALVVVDPAVDDDPVVAIRGVGIQRDVGHDQEFGKLGFQGADAALQKTVGFGARTGPRILVLIGQCGKECDPGNPRLGDFGRATEQEIHRQPGLAGHRRDRSLASLPLLHEKRQYEVGGVEFCLPHEIAQRGVGAIATGSNTHLPKVSKASRVVGSELSSRRRAASAVFLWPRWRSTRVLWLPRGRALH